MVASQQQQQQNGRSSSTSSKTSDLSPADVKADALWQRACKRAGIEPSELEKKPYESFVEKSVPEEVSVRRYNNYQNNRSRKIHLIVSEREHLQRQQQQLVPRPPPRNAPAASPAAADVSEPRSNRGGGGGSECGSDSTCNTNHSGGALMSPREMLLREARKLREFREAHNTRMQSAQRRLHDEQESLTARSYEFNENERRRRMESDMQEKLIKRANVQQMTLRRDRDRALSDMRRENLIMEEEVKRESMLEHLDELQASRRRREDVLEKRAFSRGKEESTTARTERAQKERDRHDADIRTRTERQIDLVEQRRHEHVIQQLVRQESLANRALQERATVEQKAESARLQEQKLIKTKARAHRRAMKRSERQLTQQQAERESNTKFLASIRDESLLRARAKREKIELKKAKKREESEALRKGRDDERAQRRALNDMLVREDREAKSMQRTEILLRNSRRTEALQEELREKSRRAQADAERRRREWEEEKKAALFTDDAATNQRASTPAAAGNAEEEEEL